MHVAHQRQRRDRTDHRRGPGDHDGRHQHHEHCLGRRQRGRPDARQQSRDDDHDRHPVGRRPAHDRRRAEPIIAGTSLTYTISLTNAGPSQATNVAIGDTLPTTATFAAAGPGCGNTGGLVNCLIGTVNVNVTKQVTVVVNVTWPALPGRLAVQHGRDRPRPSPTRAPATTPRTATSTISRSADVILFKVDSPDPVIAGTTLTYTFFITNNGSSQATNVTVSDTLPVSVTYLAGKSGCSSTLGVVSCTGRDARRQRREELHSDG